MDSDLKQFALTKIERDSIDAVESEGSQAAAARKLGVTPKSIEAAMKRIRQRSEKQGYFPEYDMTRAAPPGYDVKGTSTYYDRDGKIRGQWVKTNKRHEQLVAQLKIAAEAVIEPCRGLAKPTKAPKRTSNEFMACYPIAEPHMGMYAWGEESGEDYNSDIAETLLLSCMKELVASAPPSDECLIVNLADYFHTDTSENKTKASGNVLDVDTRWGRVFQIGVRVHREVIRMALKKHKTVYVKSGRGNHDEESIFCLMMMMQAYFENEPRVVIELPNNPFTYHVFGKNLIGIHHGNIKADKLPLVMATDRPDDWGRSEYRTFLHGHIHHKTVKEHPGCIIESFRSIAPKDSWHNASGYRSGRSMECIIFDKDGGEYGRRIVNVKGGSA